MSEEARKLSCWTRGKQVPTLVKELTVSFSHHQVNYCRRALKVCHAPVPALEGDLLGLDRDAEVVFEECSELVVVLGAK